MPKMKHTFTSIKPHDFDSAQAKKERQKPQKRTTSIPAGKAQLMNLSVGDEISYTIKGKVTSLRMIEKDREDEWDQSELSMELDSSELTISKPSDPEKALMSEEIDLV